MKKPEFPKPRLIREDFINNYRIKKVTKPDGKVLYYPQKKILWFWWTNIDIYPYGIEDWAQGRILSDYYKTLKDDVEYLYFDISKTFI